MAGIALLLPIADSCDIEFALRRCFAVYAARKKTESLTFGVAALTNNVREAVHVGSASVDSQVHPKQDYIEFRTYSMVVKRLHSPINPNHRRADITSVRPWSLARISPPPDEVFLGPCAVGLKALNSVAVRIEIRNHLSPRNLIAHVSTIRVGVIQDMATSRPELATKMAS
jgi:hypothetical protein